MTKVRRQEIYSPLLDRAGRRAIGWVIHRRNGDDIYAWYGKRGFPVTHPEQVASLPAVLVEERVSRLRDYWRRWLFGESAVSMVVGPAGLVVGGPMVGLILTAWATDMGWAYGQDMTEERRVDAVRSSVHRGLIRALGLPIGRDYSTWRRLVGTVLFWGFGPELYAADVVMGEIRHQFRREWEQRRSQLPFTRE